jgi:hypothetical protein
VLDIRVEIKGHKAMVGGVERFMGRLPGAIQRGLVRTIRGVHREAYDLLSGPAADTGGYPVPVVTGHLRRNLDWLEPGETKSAGGQSFSTGEFEAMLYDAARYASVIHDGTHRAAGIGERPFAVDALEAFDKNGRIQATMEEEIHTELKGIGK